MAYPIQQAVIDFHKKFGHPVRDVPRAITEEEATQAFDFIAEEVDELWEKGLMTDEDGCDLGPGCCSDYAPNVVETADALGDIVVTAYGMAIRHGIDLDAVLREVMESNMTKEANGMGKIKKGADYRPPNIRRALGI